MSKTHGTTTVTALWRRLDTPGHDACRLIQIDSGWQLAGAAVFDHNGTVAQLTYSVACDTAWKTQSGEVHGWIGTEMFDLVVRRSSDGGWHANGAAVVGLEHCTDLDLGFTPATNLLSIRRLALEVGQAAEVPAAWLDVDDRRIAVLPQRYERRSDTIYAYDAPSFDYHASLEVTSAGFVRHYPGLWELETYH